MINPKHAYLLGYTRACMTSWEMKQNECERKLKLPESTGNIHIFRRNWNDNYIDVDITIEGLKGHFRRTFASLTSISESDKLIARHARNA